jgi:hypothetical protein
MESRPARLHAEIARGDRSLRILFALVLIFGFATPVTVAQVSVLTRRNDNLRSGVNSNETILTQQSVRTGFGKLWTLFADAKIMAQPLYVANLIVPTENIIGGTAKTKCANGCNAVIFATMKGTVYAYMADQKPTTTNDTLLWATYLSRYVGCGRSLVGCAEHTGD